MRRPFFGWADFDQAQRDIDQINRDHQRAGPIGKKIIEALWIFWLVSVLALCVATVWFIIAVA